MQNKQHYAGWRGVGGDSSHFCSLTENAHVLKAFLIQSALCVSACFQIAQLDEVKIRISALRDIIDLLLLFGFQLLSETAATEAAPPSQSSPENQDDDMAVATDEKADVPEDTAQSILVMLSEFLDSEVRLRYFTPETTVCMWVFIDV